MAAACTLFKIGFFFFKQKTAYEMRMSDWSSDVCSSDLKQSCGGVGAVDLRLARCRPFGEQVDQFLHSGHVKVEVDLHREFMVAQTFGYQHPHQREGVRRFHQLFLADRKSVV